MRFLYVFVLAALFIACENVGQNNTTGDVINVTPPDTLAYIVETIRKDEPNCIPSDENPCAYFEAKYVKVTDGDAEYTIESINEQLIELLRGKEYTNVVAYANGFIEEYLTEKRDLENTMPWATTYEQNVLRNDSTVFVVATNFYSYTGGAHGYYATIYENYDRLSGKLIELQDLFEPGFENRLNEVGEQYFRRSQKLAVNRPLDELFSFENNTFELPDNFALTEEGIQFIFNPYEIASYAQGQQKFVLPYTALRTFVKAGSIAAIK